MASVIAGIGIPGSGKTTALEPLARRCGFVYISPDHIREELSGHELDHSQNARIWELAYERTITALKEGKSVVFDATQAKKKDRETFAQTLSMYASVIGVYFDISLDEALRRNKQRATPRPVHAIERMYKFLRNDPPELSEGFAELLNPEELLKRYCPQDSSSNQ